MIPLILGFGNMAEVDFIVQRGAEIIPIEVKSEKNVKKKILRKIAFLLCVKNKNRKRFEAVI